MKVLIISHNTFSTVTNVGKTLKNWFDTTDDMVIYNFYFRPMEGDVTNSLEETLCYTDFDALKSIFHIGQQKDYRKYINRYAFRENNELDKNNSLNQRRVFSKKRSDFKHFLRDYIWKHSTAKEVLSKWVKEIRPDIIFVVPGYSSFLYDLVLEVKNEYSIPLYSYFFDDYHNSNHSPFNIYQERLNKCIENMINESDRVGFISESMEKKYQGLAPDVKMETLMTPYSYYPPKKKRMSGYPLKMYFIGNISVGRLEPLKLLTKAVSVINKHKVKYDFRIYSIGLSQREINQLKVGDKHYYYGALSSKEVFKHQNEADILVHVESFKDKYKKATRHSFSTKLSNYLSSNALVLAIGPRGVFSIDYIADNSLGVAIQVNDLETIIRVLGDVYSQWGTELVHSFIEQSRLLSQQNHDPHKNKKELIRSLEKVIYE